MIWGQIFDGFDRIAVPQQDKTQHTRYNTQHTTLNIQPTTPQTISLKTWPGGMRVSDLPLPPCGGCEYLSYGGRGRICMFLACFFLTKKRPSNGMKKKRLDKHKYVLRRGDHRKNTFLQTQTVSAGKNVSAETYIFCGGTTEEKTTHLYVIVFGEHLYTHSPSIFLHGGSKSKTTFHHQPPPL